MTCLKGMLAIALTVMFAATLMFAQAPAGAKPSFEVASVKPSPPGTNFATMLGGAGGRLTANNVTLPIVDYAEKIPTEN